VGSKSRRPKNAIATLDPFARGDGEDFYRQGNPTAQSLVGEQQIAQSFMRPKGVELSKHQPLPPFRSREFWSPWRITHIRELANSGKATGEIWLPETERSSRALDQLYLKTSQTSESRSVDMSTPFAAGNPLLLSSPLYLGDMSFGALSGVPNLAIAKAADATGVIAGTGEGGLLKEVAECRMITVQWASARFGVDIHSLRRGQAVVIKIGQGAKPGIGGHLPGAKVTAPISETRRIPLGTDAISPAPHHDIYSIEDLGQRIMALKEATGKPIFVKVGATNYISYIALGIARMGASGIIIDGSGAGTGAAPTVVKENVGIPTELAVASVDSALRREGLREDFTVVAAGRVSCPEDSLKLVALGADITSLGSATLLALGCLMVHKCHIGFCPAILTNKISDNPARTLSLGQSVIWATNLVRGWTEEMKQILAAMGLSSVRELRSRRDLLIQGGGLNVETLEILGLGGSGKSTSSAFPTRPPVDSTLWGLPRSGRLWEMAGVTGKFPGEPQISSMGSVGAPFVEAPVRVSDWLVTDGAQVTRPSIDPYREKIELAAFLGGGKIRLAAPFFFTHPPGSLPEEILGVQARTAAAMGLLCDDSMNRLAQSKYSTRIIRPAAYAGGSLARAVDLEHFLADRAAHAAQRSIGETFYLRVPSSEEALKWVRLNEADLPSFDGIIVDEDLDGSDQQLELSVSRLDSLLVADGMRKKLDIVAEGNLVRGSEDIFKLLALGADCVGIGKASLFAVGFEEGKGIVIEIPKLTQHLENFVVALEKEIKLLAGAAGVSSVSSSVTGNRELLRSVGLDPSIREQLGVKPAGAR